jgi:amino acid transporter
MPDSDTSQTAYKQKENSQNENDPLQPTASCGEARIGEVEESRNGQFHRSFSPRQVHVRIP